MTLYNPFTKAFTQRPIYRGSDWKVELELYEVDNDTGERTALDISDYTAVMFLGRDAEIEKEFTPSGNTLTLSLPASEQTDLANPEKNCEPYPIEVVLYDDDERIMLIRDNIAVYRSLGEI